MKHRSEEAKKSARRHGRRKLAISLNTAAGLALAGLIVFMVNYLSYRHYVRMDWSRSGYYSLSDKTLGLLDSLTNEVHVVVFLTPEHDEYEDVRNLLKEYEYASNKIQVEYVDPNRDLARTEQLAMKFDVDLLDAGVVVFESLGRTKYVKPNDIVEKDYSMTPYGESPTRSAFKGEQAFSSALQSISQSRKPIVYFLQGHGERNIESFDRFEGYSELAKVIRRDNIDLQTVVLGEMSALPKDMDALVVAGPQKRLSQPEVDLLARYIQENGRMLVLLDASATSGLEPMLKDWRIRLDDDVVVDGTRTITGRELFITDYGRHPVSQKFQGIMSVLYFPRSVMPIEAKEEDATADRPRVTVLAQSSAAGWAESDLEQNPMKFDAGLDKPGPVPVAVAVERGPGPGIDVEIRPSRLVVFGDSDFLANDAASGGNTDFFMSALNWLLEREALMAIAPKPVEELRLVMTRDQLRMLFWLVVVGLPGIVGVFGAGVWLKRRS